MRIAGLNKRTDQITSGTKKADDMAKNLRILIADDHDLMRRGLKAWLNRILVGRFVRRRTRAVKR